MREGYFEMCVLLNIIEAIIQDIGHFHTWAQLCLARLSSD